MNDDIHGIIRGAGQGIFGPWRWPILDAIPQVFASPATQNVYRLDGHDSGSAYDWEYNAVAVGAPSSCISWKPIAGCAAIVPEPGRILVY